MTPRRVALAIDESCWFFNSGDIIRVNCGILANSGSIDGGFLAAKYNIRRLARRLTV